MKPPNAAGFSDLWEIGCQLTLACGSPPGFAQWTGQLLAEALVADGVVETISAATVNIAQKTRSIPGIGSPGANRDRPARAWCATWRTHSTCTRNPRTPSGPWPASTRLPRPCTSIPDRPRRLVPDACPAATTVRPRGRLQPLPVLRPPAGLAGDLAGC